MNDTLEATTGNAENPENGLKIVSGTRGREFESHRPDHLSKMPTRKLAFRRHEHAADLYFAGKPAFRRGAFQRCDGFQPLGLA